MENVHIDVSKSVMGLRWRTDCQPFNFQDLVSNSPYCLPYSSCDVSFFLFLFLVILITCLLDIILIL